MSKCSCGKDDMAGSLRDFIGKGVGISTKTYGTKGIISHVGEDYIILMECTNIYGDLEISPLHVRIAFVDSFYPDIEVEEAYKKYEEKEEES